MLFINICNIIIIFLFYLKNILHKIIKYFLNKIKKIEDMKDFNATNNLNNIHEYYKYSLSKNINYDKLNDDVKNELKTKYYTFNNYNLLNKINNNTSLYNLTNNYIAI